VKKSTTIPEISKFPRGLLFGAPMGIGVEAGGTSPLPKIGKKYFSGNYHVKFGHFVNFSYIYFRARMSCPQMPQS